MHPYLGQLVHYTAYGTPGGEYPSVCRAAHVTAVGDSPDPATPNQLDLHVINPSGQFFNRDTPHGDIGQGGTWHFPHAHPEPI